MYYFYILKCKDGTLYCGSSKDIHHRELMHNSGRGSKYVRSRGGGKIIYTEELKTLSQVLKREAEVKRWSREEKMVLIKSKKRSFGLRPQDDAKGVNFAAIFDMDGVLVNNIRYHFRSYQIMGQDLGFKVGYKEFLQKMSGRRNTANFEYALVRKLSPGEAKSIAEKKERLYRQLYRPHIRALPGLISFLDQLKKAKIKVVLASSAPAINIRFIFRALGVKKYFRYILHSSDVKHGKPNPEIYLKAGKLARTAPAKCVVFEDAVNGVLAAKRAKMKVVGVATTLTPKQLNHTDLVIKDFKNLTVDKVKSLFSK